ncbi:nucleotide exchange factor GrpE [Candidatus Ruminimicrobiellum ovillum]|uniref:nucleotide exchange factor GrpE n=1 Tax=Candidatus Ruminimicrobiellum ovillum TaxID=1947927 RepID=UPI00355A6FBB
MKNKEKEEQKIEAKAEKIAEEKIEKAEEKVAEKVEDIAREVKLSELDILKQSLKEKQKQADEYKAEYLRSVAEYQTLRNRTEKEKGEYINFGKAKILERNISIYDVFEQAMISVRAGQDLKSIKVGLEMIYNEFSKMLKEEGVEKIDCLNKKFDHNVCEALDQVETDEAEEGTVLAVYQNGYKLNGKLMRPARVKVAKKKEEEKVAEEENSEEK